MTIAQVEDESKDVTRRFGWWFLRPGDRVWAVEKAMGLQKGEKVKRLRQIEIVSTRREPLGQIDYEDCCREGFPNFEPREFVDMLKAHYRVSEAEPVNRIEFRYVPRGQEIN